MFNSREIERYARHIVLKGVGGPGQHLLKSAKVLIIGAGGLGSPVIAYLAAAGVGQITIADDDEVSLSNLQRQIVFCTNDLGKDKAQSATNFAKNLNDDIVVQALSERITEQNGVEQISAHDLVVDGTDRFSSRLQIAKAAEIAKRPLVSGAVSMFDGQVTLFAPHLTDDKGNLFPGFSCLYSQTPDESDLPACETVGILGAVTGVIGSLMAMETIKFFTGTGDALIGRLLLYDGRNAKFSELKYSRRQGPLST